MLFYVFFYIIFVFNNVGFVLSGDSFFVYVGDLIINFIIFVLFIIGGFGFFVWIEFYKKCRW